MLCAERGFVLALATDDCSVSVDRCFDVRGCLCNDVKIVTVARKKGVRYHSVKMS
jgi:hypothetical protein